LTSPPRAPLKRLSNHVSNDFFFSEGGSHRTKYLLRSPSTVSVCLESTFRNRPKKSIRPIKCSTLHSSRHLVDSVFRTRRRQPPPHPPRRHEPRISSASTEKSSSAFFNSGREEGEGRVGGHRINLTLSLVLYTSSWIERWRLPLFSSFEKIIRRTMTCSAIPKGACVDQIICKWVDDDCSHPTLLTRFLEIGAVRRPLNKPL